MPISKLHSILAEFFAHNNISQICYCGQISLQSAAANSIFFFLQSDTFGGNIYFAGDDTWQFIQLMDSDLVNFFKSHLLVSHVFIGLTFLKPETFSSHECLYFFHD